MVTTTLPDGRLKHILDNWTGFQNPNEPMTKTKWYRDDVEYHEVKGSTATYIVTRDNMGKINWTDGFFRKDIGWRAINKN